MCRSTVVLYFFFKEGPRCVKFQPFPSLGSACIPDAWGRLPAFSDGEAHLSQLKCWDTDSKCLCGKSWNWGVPQCGQTQERGLWPFLWPHHLSLGFCLSLSVPVDWLPHCVHHFSPSALLFHHQACPLMALTCVCSRILLSVSPVPSASLPVITPFSPWLPILTPARQADSLFSVVRCQHRALSSVLGFHFLCIRRHSPLGSTVVTWGSGSVLLRGVPKKRKERPACPG